MRVSLDVDDALHRKIRVAAAERGLSMNAWIREVLARAADPPMTKTPDPDPMEAIYGRR